MGGGKGKKPKVRKYTLDMWLRGNQKYKLIVLQHCILAFHLCAAVLGGPRAPVWEPAAHGRERKVH